MKVFVAGFASLVILTLAGQAQAAAVFYNNQAAWQAAAGPASYTEDFSSFGADTSFRAASVALNGMSIAQEGFPAEFRNLVDVAAFQFGDNGGTSHASMFTEGDRGTFVRITFNNLTTALGFQTWLASDGEGAGVEVWNGGTLLGSQILSNAAGAFTGFVLTGGDVATSVRFYSVRSNGSNTGGEGFGLDNLAAVSAGAQAVPEPTTVAMWTLGVLGMAISRINRRKLVSE